MIKFLLLFLLPQVVFAQGETGNINKREVLTSVESHQQELIQLSEQIWGFAETAMQETQSAKVLADYAESQGFRVSRGVAGIPTAFTAEYGSGKLKGTIRFYGTPAEEMLVGKVLMAKAGLFDDLDVCLDWHPDYENKANMQSSLAVEDYTISFKGKSAHASLDSWNGRSALDAAELFTIGINFQREHVKPSVRMHYVFTKGGTVPNIVPEEASVWLWIRDAKRSGVEEVSARMKEIARGAALMAGVDCDIKLNSGLYELLINESGAKVLQTNMNFVGPLIYTKDEIDFADKIMKECGNEPKGLKGAIQPLEVTTLYPDGSSTDVGDVSQIVPEITLWATATPFEAPWHSWVVTACSGMSIGHKGMIFAAKTLGATMVDLFENEKLRQDIRAEFVKKKGNEVYTAILPEAKPPEKNKGLNKNN